MSRRRIIVDTETTDLTPDYVTGRGTIWELAAIELDGEHGPAERLWRMKPDASMASAAALTVGRYYERTADMRGPRCTVDDLMEPNDSGAPQWSHPTMLAPYVAKYLSGATLIGAVPSFDAGFLAAFLRAHGEAPSWHYRIRDFGSLAWGALQAQGAGSGCPPIDAGTDDFARALGIDLDGFERHTALGDCRLVAAGLSVIEGWGSR